LGPDFVIRVQADKPAEQRVVIHLFHQQPLAADRIQHLQQLCLRNNFSGAIDGRPTQAYMVSNRRDNRLATSSTISRMVRRG